MKKSYHVKLNKVNSEKLKIFLEKNKIWFFTSTYHEFYFQTGKYRTLISFEIRVDDAELCKVNTFLFSLGYKMTERKYNG